MNSSHSFLSLHRGLRCAERMFKRSPMPLACVGQTETHRMQPIQSAWLTSLRLSKEMAPVGHSLAQVPHSAHPS